MGEYKNLNIAPPLSANNKIEPEKMNIYAWKMRYNR